MKLKVLPHDLKPLSKGLHIPICDFRSLVAEGLPGSKKHIESSKQFIIDEMAAQNLGFAERVDIILKYKKNSLTKHSLTHYTAFVHFEMWFNNPTANALQRDIISPTTKAKLFIDSYNNGWKGSFDPVRRYWILNLNRNPKPAPTTNHKFQLKVTAKEFIPKTIAKPFNQIEAADAVAKAAKAAFSAAECACLVKEMVYIIQFELRYNQILATELRYNQILASDAAAKAVEESDQEQENYKKTVNDSLQHIYCQSGRVCKYSGIDLDACGCDECMYEGFDCSTPRLLHY